MPDGGREKESIMRSFTTRSARRAYALLSLMTAIVFIGGFVAVSRKAEAPVADLSNNETRMALTLTSPAFEDGGVIPSEYTCDGANVNPELRIGGVPEGTRSLVLVMDDPDIPESVKQARGIDVFDHWVLYDIPPTTDSIPKGAPVGTAGLNGLGVAGYAGPCPPDREHRYIFRLYAVSGTLEFVKAPSLKEVEDAAKGMAIESATLIGRYNRPVNVTK
ncbi:MAG TPA: YbhB/YbcL family Raf kinase inhibitor-like protein [Candidatus Paceibacterota bacterium]|nr:YbhB/YbcL family Raf kinase inhibitor-like protein [Candidatus Paceibacterota bacterium]